MHEIRNARAPISLLVLLFPSQSMVMDQAARVQQKRALKKTWMTTTAAAMPFLAVILYVVLCAFPISVLLSCGRRLPWRCWPGRFSHRLEKADGWRSSRRLDPWH
jgi:hypothetical protein